MRRAVVLFLLVGFAVGCGSESPTGPNLEQLLSEGWAAWQAGDYTTAQDRFEGVLDADPDNSAAHTGLGWTHLRELRPALARVSFESVPPGGTADAAAGLVLAYAAEDANARVRDHGTAFIAANPGYVFPRDPTYALTDIRWLVARAALVLADYEGFLAQADVLSPGHGLNPESADFLERAAALLETLRATV